MMKNTGQPQRHRGTERKVNLKKSFRLFRFFSLCLCASVAFVVSAAAQDLRWGGDAEGGAPYLLPDPKNPRRIIGFEIDLMEALAKQLNRKSVFVQNQWDGLIPGLQRGSYDLAVNGIEITDDRKQQVSFSIPYYACGEQLSVRVGENSINSIADLKGRTVGTLKFSLAHRLLEQAKRDFHVGNLYINRKCTGALVDVHPFGGFNMSGTDSKAGGRDYLLLFLQAKSVAEKY